MTAGSTTSPADGPNGQPSVGAAPVPSGLERVVLTGFMGSGKSTVGRLLAEHLGWTFADLDACVEKDLGIPVPQIFSRYGEPAFRAAEVDALEKLLARSQQVIALGGGAPGTPALRRMLLAASRTAVVHLHAPFVLLYERCRAQALDPAFTDRPLLGDEPTTAQRYGERLELYRAISHYAADAAAGPPEEIAVTLLQQLGLRRSP